MNLRRIATVVLTVLAIAVPATARVNEMKPRGAPAPSAETRTPPQRAVTPQRSHGSRADEQRYAEREAKAKNAKKFRGGEPVVVISATVAIIILLGVLIIVLLT